jgi:hypothetical protein
VCAVRADGYLSIGSQRYSGTNCPRGVNLHTGTEIHWRSDGSLEKQGWQICAEAAHSSGAATTTGIIDTEMTPEIAVILSCVAFVVVA